MIASLNAPSARVYQFTARKREDTAPVARGRAEVIELRPAASPAVVFCVGASYHEDAIAEEARARRGRVF